MKQESSAIADSRTALSGLGWGLIGVLAFSFTVPFTRVAVGGLDPLFIAAGRAVVAALLAGIALVVTGQPLPRGRQWPRLIVVALGVVFGFPLLTTYALTTVPASHGAVVIALLPAATAVLAVLRGREHPPVAFWATAAVGAGVAVLFASVQGGGLGHFHRSDLFLFGAVLAAAVGYAEGGLLSRTLGSWQTISWALIVSAPPMTVLTVVSLSRGVPAATPAEWGSFAYLAAVSMFLGFVAWYRGLAIGPMSRVSQIQLIQPVFTIGWATVLLSEPLTWTTAVAAAAVIASAAAAVRTR
nr:DMT family transporter [uncultured Actinoplanes sp.]